MSKELEKAQNELAVAQWEHRRFDALSKKMNTELQHVRHLRRALVERIWKLPSGWAP